MSEPKLSSPLADSTALSRAQHEALTHLRVAAEYARDLRIHVWQFAVSRAELVTRGIMDSDLRWLISKGYLAHAIERTCLGATQRAFRRIANLQILARSCFVLTEDGERLALALNRFPIRADRAVAVADTPASVGKTEVPIWDQASHTLYFRGRVVKCYRSEAPYQEAILSAFQVNQWTACVAVCMPQDWGVCLKTRLHDTVKNLNRATRPHLRFRQEGSGSRVRWERWLACPNGVLSRDPGPPS
jgi:hypothetical protein